LERSKRTGFRTKWKSVLKALPSTEGQKRECEVKEFGERS